LEHAGLRPNTASYRCYAHTPEGRPIVECKPAYVIRFQRDTR